MAKSVEEIRDELIRFMDLADRGEATRADGIRLLAAVGPEIERVCATYGADSTNCRNSLDAYQQVQAIVMKLPGSAPSHYGIGTVVGVGIAGVALGIIGTLIAKR